MTTDQLRKILADALEGAAERLRTGSGPDVEPVPSCPPPPIHEPLPDVTGPTLNVEDVAGLLGISRSLAYESIRTGDIPSLRVGRRLLG